MKLIYEEIKSELGFVIKCTKEDGSILWIPTDPANSDYQAYLAHLTESVTKAK